MTQSYYEILGVGEKATQEEIKAAYLRLAKQYHPDKNQGDPEAEQRFQQIAEAYTALKDPGSRLLYDKTGQTHQPKIEDDVRELLLAAFQSALIEDEGDILEEARDFIHEVEQKLLGQRQQIEARMRKLTAKRDKVKAKVATNLFHIAIDGESKTLSQTNEQIGYNLRVVQACYKALEKYESIKETPPRFTHTVSLIPTEIDFNRLMEHAVRRQGRKEP